MTRGRAIVVTTALLVVAAVLVLVFVLRLSTKPNARTNLAASTFTVGPAERLAPEVAIQPLLFQDLLDRSRDIYVQHLGRDSLTGWSAFEAHAPGEARTCQLRWRRSTKDFSDPCTHHVYPADGSGLPHFKTTIDTARHVVVDLRTTT